MVTRKIAYLHPTHIARTLVLVYLCFSLSVVGLLFFMGFVRYGELPTIIVLNGLVLNALVDFGALRLTCHAYN